ncbi:MAG: hypothetical protein Q8P18_22910 [Pseudomonadota bacterium]|nr:hypothetical protein [Pseudomonadota bacterium]
MNTLFAVYALVEQLGLPIAILAWLTVFAGAVAQAVGLRAETRAHARAFLGMFALSLAAHLLDYFLTLAITPDLSQEANPIWRVALASFGLPLAKAYGLTGKLFVCLTAAWCYVYYLTRRTRLFPVHAATFAAFVQGFGATSRRVGGVRWGPISHLFAFLYAWLGPFFFYISFLNFVGGVWEDMTLYTALPSPVAAVAGYLFLLVVIYFRVNYRVYREASASPTAASPR